jgi:hypothetical protein
MQAPDKEPLVFPVCTPETFEPIGTFKEDEEFSDAVMKATLPPMTMDDSEKATDRFQQRYAHLFRSEQDCEYIAMLPVQMNQKMDIIKRALELQQEAKDQVCDIYDFVA